MVVDKSWMEIENRKDIAYINGVDGFLDFAFENLGIGQTIRCPCLKCRNVSYKQRSDVKYHLIKYDIVKSYSLCYFHGEKWDESIDSDDDDIGDHEAPFDDMIGLVNSIFNVSNVSATVLVESSNISSNETIQEPK